MFERNDRVLTAVWILVAALVISAFLLVIHMAYKKKSGKSAALHGAVTDESSDEPNEESDAYISKRNSDLQHYRNKYREMFLRMSMPENAPVVQKCSCVFSLEHCVLDHYFWCSGDVLYFFPTWESIALYLVDPAYMPVTTGKERKLIFGWAIPVHYLDYYAVHDEGGYTAVYYRDKAGRRYRTVFLDGARDIFDRLFPDRNYAIVQRRAYLGSSANISNMSERMTQLQIKRDQGLITEQEYETQRDYLMRSF
ncbi:MAG: hypothetical protein LBV27_08025 [Oscillospiraceae bacterium]|nr:hypothetical protein [Oscillospiraceae bacterium]